MALRPVKVLLRVHCTTSRRMRHSGRNKTYLQNFMQHLPQRRNQTPTFSNLYLKLSQLKVICSGTNKCASCMGLPLLATKTDHMQRQTCAQWQPKNTSISSTITNATRYIYASCMELPPLASKTKSNATVDVRQASKKVTGQHNTTSSNKRLPI